MEAYEKINTPNCLPINKPRSIPKGTGKRSEEKDNPSNETPAFAKAKSGIMKKAT